MSTPPAADPTVAVVRTGPQLRRLGGIAAHVVAGTYVVGFLAMLAYLAPRGFVDATSDPASSLTFLREHPAAMYAWYLVLYLLGGTALPVVVLALHERLHPVRPTSACVATAFGLIWSGLLLASGMTALVGQRAVLDLAATDRATAVTSWHALSVVQDALGGGIELVGAAWLLCVCAASLRSRTLPATPAALGIVIGAAGLATLLPAIAETAASLFGIGLIAWFTWTAQTLLGRAGGPAHRPRRREVGHHE